MFHQRSLSHTSPLTQAPRGRSFLRNWPWRADLSDEVEQAWRLPLECGCREDHGRGGWPGRDAGCGLDFAALVLRGMVADARKPLVSGLELHNAGWDFIVDGHDSRVVHRQSGLCADFLERSWRADFACVTTRANRQRGFTSLGQTNSG